MCWGPKSFDFRIRSHFQFIDLEQISNHGKRIIQNLFTYVYTLFEDQRMSKLAERDYPWVGSARNMMKLWFSFY